MEQSAVPGYEFEWLRLADPALYGEGQCNARFSRTIPCDGEHVPSEGLCLRHACLFDLWIDQGGFRAYKFKQDEHGESLEKWRRAQFYKWLDGLTIKQVERLLG